MCSRSRLDDHISDINAELLDAIHVISADARRVDDIAQEMNVATGAIINPIACTVGDQPVLVLMAGDMACDADHVARAFNRVGTPVTRLSNADLAQLTGKGADHLFAIEWASEVPTIMDASLKRFEKLYSRAGARQCLVETTYDELKAMTRAIVSYALAPTDWFIPKD